MRMFEYEAKVIFSKLNIAIPKGGVASSPAEAEKVAQDLGGVVVVKAQVLSGGRGKAGGIKYAYSPEEAQKYSGALLGHELLGSKVEKVLVEERLVAQKEIYLGITVDRTLRKYVLLLSAEGGIDVEEIADGGPEKMVRFPIDPLLGLRIFEARDAVLRIGIRGPRMLALANILMKAYEAVIEYDAELVEINPLVETAEGRFFAADAKMVIDDNSLYRHRNLELAAMKEGLGMTQMESEAMSKGFSYVELDGDVGVIGNGAGLVMATLDLLQLAGRRPANFLDIGVGASSEVMRSALSMVLRSPKVRVVVVNILGGITHCDEVAIGILDALKGARARKPIVVRMVGTREGEAKRLLSEAGLIFSSSMEEAVQMAAEITSKAKVEL